MRFLLAVVVVLAFLPFLFLGFFIAMILGALETGWRRAILFQGWLSRGRRRYL